MGRKLERAGSRRSWPSLVVTGRWVGWDGSTLARRLRTSFARSNFILILCVAGLHIAGRPPGGLLERQDLTT